MVSRYTFQRDFVKILKHRLSTERKFIQVISGPRQVGKTVAVQQVIEQWDKPVVYATADLPAPPQPRWIEEQWDLAHLRLQDEGPVLLVLDEIQKVSGWSEIVKRLWEEDTRLNKDIRVVILGSSALLIQSGLTESLAGRFELIYATHWTYDECKTCFKWDFDTYIYFGGYPGAAVLINDHTRWANYIRDSLIETTLNKDILLLTRVEKPALLRQLYVLSCEYAGQIVSYHKMMGQLHDAGNTTTLAHYQRLLESAQILKGLPKWSGGAIRRRASSPKWIILNNALITAVSGLDFKTWREDPSRWGRLSEVAVGAHLINTSFGTGIEVYYWRDHNREVDFILKQGDKLLAVEIKTGILGRKHSGLTAFNKKYPRAKSLLIGPEGLPVIEFISQPTDYWMDYSYN